MLSSFCARDLKFILLPSKPCMKIVGVAHTSPPPKLLAFSCTACGPPVHIVLDIDTDEPANITGFLAFEWTQAGPQSFRVNDIAPRNMESMVVTQVTYTC